MNKIFSFLGKVGKEALKDVPVIVGQVYPPLSGLMGVISSLTLKAQTQVGPGQNETKKQMVLDDLGLFQPFILPLVEAVSGRNLDDDAFNKLIADAIDISVQWHKLVGTIPTPNTAPSQGTAPVAPAPPASIPGVVVSGPGISPVA